MNTSVKVILTAASLAVLASPVMAHSERTHAGTSISHARGAAVGHARTTGEGYAPPMETNNHVPSGDCVRVGFPQCSGGN
jgi:hypothetical protein